MANSLLMPASTAVARRCVSPAHELDQLVMEFRAGRTAAFEELFRRLADDLRHCVCRYTVDNDMIDEVVQRSFIRALERLPNYELRGTFRAWLRGITRLVLLEELRARRKRAEHEGLGMSVELLAAAEAELDEPDAMDDARPALARCLAKASSRNRSLIERHHVDGEPITTLARDFKTPANTLKVTLFRIRRSLAKCLREQGVML